MKHSDTENPHIHIIINRVSFGKKAKNDSFSRTQIARICDKIELKYGLVKASQVRKNTTPYPFQPTNKPIHSTLKDPNQKRNLFKNKIKNNIEHTFRINPKANFVSLAKVLAEKNIQLKLRIQSTGRVSGITFFQGGMSLKGSEVDAAYKYNQLCKRMQQDPNQKITLEKPIPRAGYLDVLTQKVILDTPKKTPIINEEKIRQEKIAAVQRDQKKYGTYDKYLILRQKINYAISDLFKKEAMPDLSKLAHILEKEDVAFNLRVDPKGHIKGSSFGWNGINLPAKSIHPDYSIRSLMSKMNYTSSPKIQYTNITQEDQKINLQTGQISPVYEKFSAKHPTINIHEQLKNKQQKAILKPYISQDTSEQLSNKQLSLKDAIKQQIQNTFLKEKIVFLKKIVDALQEKKIDMYFRIQKSGKINGISFSKEGESLKGTLVGTKYRYGNLMKSIGFQKFDMVQLPDTIHSAGTINLREGKIHFDNTKYDPMPINVIEQVNQHPKDFSFFAQKNESDHKTVHTLEDRTSFDVSDTNHWKSCQKQDFEDEKAVIAGQKLGCLLQNVLASNLDMEEVSSQKNQTQDRIKSRSKSKGMGMKRGFGKKGD